ncbi:MAG: hypothetical protein IIY07_03345, partial [Thermoguttaceae bacterium]|nr:hypothetical protein [Thermoguttaceae bacterium]
MRNLLNLISAVILIAAAFVVFPSSVDAQGWRLFVDDVKDEAKKKREQENGVPTPDANADDVASSQSSAPNAVDP